MTSRRPGRGTVITWVVGVVIIGSFLARGLFLTSESSIPVRLVLLLVALLACLVIQTLMAIRVRGLLCALMLLQVFYWFMGYLVRPIVLLWAQPTPRLSDPIADTRLSTAGYTKSIGEILPLIVVGLVVYLVAIFLMSRGLNITSQLSTRHIKPQNAAVVIAIGWAFRLLYAALGRGNISTLIDTGTLFAVVGVGAIILFAPTAPRGFLLLALVGSELAWAVLAGSKTAILAVLLWVLIRQYMDGRLSVRAMSVGAVAGISGFYAITNVKVGNGSLTATDTVASYYPAPVELLFPVIARFDALQSMADAYFAGSSSWIGPGAASLQAVKSLLPTSIVGAKVLSGETWGTEVRTLSLPGGPGASLAQPPIAEGWVIAGWAGIAAEVIILAALMLIVVKLLQSKKLPLMLLGVSMTSAPYLYERGTLGALEGMGKGVQVALVAGFIIWVLDQGDRKFNRLTYRAQPEPDQVPGPSESPVDVGPPALAGAPLTRRARQRRRAGVPTFS